MVDNNLASCNVCGCTIPVVFLERLYWYQSKENFGVGLYQQVYLCPHCEVSRAEFGDYIQDELIIQNRAKAEVDIQFLYELLTME